MNIRDAALRRAAMLRPAEAEPARISLATLRRGGVRQAPDTRAQDVRSISWRGLTYAYLLGLGLLASVTLGGGWLVYDLLHRQSEHAGLISEAGAQRTRAVEIAALAATAADAGAADRAWAQARLPAAVEEMDAAHRRLLARTLDLAERGEALRRFYLGMGGLDARVRGFLDGAAQAAARPEAAAALRAAALHGLLPALSEAVAQHEDAARADVRRLSLVHQLAVGAALLLLLVEAVLVFRPLVGRIAALAGRLDHEARSDALTGLMNRRAVTAALAEVMGTGEPVAVIAIDLDHFKETNDAEGHAAGDALLRAAAARIREATRPGDILGRLGGDEFVAFLRHTASEEEAAAVARRLSEALHQPVPHGPRSLRLGATMGVALAPTDADTPERILRAADEALIRAKRRGRGSVGRATPEDSARVAREAQLAQALAQAGDGPLPGLEAWMQPVLSAGGALLGLEVQARWRHPALGAVPAGELFAVAQRQGLAHRVARQLRAEGLRRFAALRREGLADGRAAVSLSAAELLRDDVAEVLEAQVAEAGLDLRSLLLGITEDALLDRVAATSIARLSALRGQGAAIALEDFGTGNAGLAQLLRMPLDAVRLDRAFTARLGTDGRAERVVEGVIRLAHSLQLSVVAAGVEDAAQAALLRAMGCDGLQGGLLAPPMAGEALRGWLAGRHALPAGPPGP
ncbi:EAL domain-containing protein [Roseococcus sp. DSY-14]|uniref:EAL domain-containing protein n=1 Tax=Roseococcus sp. DSY-14 TaxID=3369650 RepID=UPI00387B48A8